MALWLLLLVVTSVAVQGQNVKAPPQPTPEPTPEPAPKPPPSPEPSPSPAPCAGYECPEYEIIDTRGGDIQTRRYQKGQWVKYPVPGDDFIFMAAYGTERLEGFFEGENYEHKVIKKSTPMRVEFNIWSLEAEHYAAYFVPLEEQTTVPSPFPPTEIDTHDEIYIFSKEYNATTDFATVARAVAETMVDLTLDRSPFDMDSVYLAMYEYPKGNDAPRQNDEIWLKRTFPPGAQPSVEVLREAGRNASQVLDMVQRRMLN